MDHCCRRQPLQRSQPTQPHWYHRKLETSRENTGPTFHYELPLVSRRNVTIRGAVAKSTWAISALSKRWQVHAHTEEKLSFSTNFGRSPPTSRTKLTQNSFQIISATTVKPRPPPTQEKIFVQISHGCASTNIEIDFLSPHASSNKDVPMLL